MKTAVSIFFVTPVLAVAVLTTHQSVLAQRPSPAGMTRFHHVHLNSVNPKEAAEYYSKPFAASAMRTTFNGYEAVKTGDLHILFAKVNSAPKSELMAPQSAVWHFGWNTPDSQQYNQKFRSMGLKIAQMWDSNDGRLIDMSTDMPLLPGPSNAFLATEVYPTQEQIFELRAQGAQPTRKGGFGYLRGPDGAMIENAQGTVERFNHMHMYHEHPQCAMIWYVTYLDATLPAGRGGAPGMMPTAENCKRPYSPPTFPSFAKSGFVREPRGGVSFGDISISMVPWPGGGLQSTRGYVVDHFAIGVSDLDARMARMKSAGVKVLEDIHPWGSMRAAMVEGPDRAAIELVEAK
jgi:catechol 2,3-dioxygenase-like lactoylglutathione lyase family enzyme